MRVFLLIILFSIPKFILSQISSHDTLKEIIISDNKVKSSIQTQIIDSNILIQNQQNSLQQLLQLHSNIYVKNYGVGALSTISIRGSSAAQTTLNWQGISINNAISGIADMSNMPLALFDKITIHYSSENSATVSGSIELENKKPIFEKKQSAEVAYNFESLNNHFLGLRFQISNPHNAFDLKTFYKNSKNIFLYENPEKGFEEYMTHAKSISKGILSNYYWKINSLQNLSIHFWAQTNNREIPAATFEDLSLKNEINQSIRLLTKYQFNKNNFSSLSSFAFIRENYQYSDSVLSLTSKYSSLDIPFSETIQFKINPKQTFSLETNYRFSKIINHSNESIQRCSFNLFYENTAVWKPLYFKFFLQKEFSTIFSVPLSFGFLAKQKIFSAQYIFLTAYTNYRTPTLNELYYNPGGNPELKPEIGKNVEIGTENSFHVQNHVVKNNLSFYNRNVKNWIVWYGGNILTPHNLQEVWSRGIDWDFSYQHRFKNIKNTKFLFHTLYAYTLSTNTSSSISNDYSIGKQIPYVPRYQIKIQTQFSYSKWDGGYIFSYTGYRFVTTDESEWLKPFSTHNLYSSYSFDFKHSHLKLNFSINNILNHTYESIVGRVMPRRNYSLGFILKTD